MGRKLYVGDSVYAEFDGNGLVLTTENGLGPSNKIYLEPQVLGNINAFWGLCTQPGTRPEPAPDIPEGAEGSGGD